MPYSFFPKSALKQPLFEKKKNHKRRMLPKNGWSYGTLRIRKLAGLWQSGWDTKTYGYRKTWNKSVGMQRIGAYFVKQLLRISAESREYFGWATVLHGFMIIWEFYFQLQTSLQECLVTSDFHHSQLMYWIYYQTFL